MNNLAKQIAAIKWPTTNVYYELNSSDGFAFLGTAKHLSSISAAKEIEAVEKRGCAIDAAYTILGTDIRPKSIFLYTLWPVMEFAVAAQIQKFSQVVIDGLKKINRYSNGMLSYCEQETYYLVPNATSAGMLCYAMAGFSEEAKKLMGILCESQLPNGNWQYWLIDKSLKLKSPRKNRVEDCMHLAMILYHITETCRLLRIEPDTKIMSRGIACLKKQITKGCEGSIGWGVPMVYAVSEMLDPELLKDYKKRTVNYLQHSNFRVRAYSAWALAMKR